MVLGKATSNADAVDRIRTRLVDEVGELLHLCRANEFYPLWLLSRSMFPIAESIAALLYGGATNLSGSPLSAFIHNDLGAIEPRYRELASMLCQIWQHGMSLDDECSLVVRSASADLGSVREAISWRLAFDYPTRHLVFDDCSLQVLQFTFSIKTFYDHLILVLDDQAKWSAFKGDQLMDRYNERAINVLEN